MQNISKKLSGAIIVVIIVIVAGGLFWQASVKEKQAQMEQKQAEIVKQQELSQANDIPQWEKDALVEREKLGYPALSDGWRLFRSEEYGFEVGYRKEWLKDNQDANVALDFYDSEIIPHFFFMDIRPRNSHDKTMIDTALESPTAQHGSVDVENIRKNPNAVREKLLDTKTKISKIGFLWLMENGNREGVIWNDVNGTDIFWTSIITANKEYFFSGNMFGQPGGMRDVNPRYNDFMIFLGSFRILN